MDWVNLKQEWLDHFTKVGYSLVRVRYEGDSIEAVLKYEDDKLSLDMDVPTGLRLPFQREIEDYCQENKIEVNVNS